MKDDSLTGADILESSLGKVPSAAAADAAARATSADSADYALLAANSNALGGFGPDAYEKVPTTLQYYTVPATALVDADGQNRANVFVTSLLGKQQWCTKSGGDALQAAVHLPQQATIVSEQIDYEDDPGTPASNGPNTLTRMPPFPGDGSYADIFANSMVNTGTPGAAGTFLDGAPASGTKVVDNTAYAYTMISTPVAGAAVCAIQIAYTIPRS